MKNLIYENEFPKGLDSSRQVKNFKKTTQNFKFQRHISTDSPVIFSSLMYRALEVEFIINGKMLIVTTK